MRKIVNLNFNWHFAMYKEIHIEDYKNILGFKSVNVPHSIVDTGYNYVNPESTQVIGSYRKVIDIRNEYKGKVVKLIFEGVAHQSRVFINGEYITSHFGGYDRFEVDISDYINYGEDNYLTVVVNSLEKENVPPFGGNLDFLGYGGIYREVFLEIHEEEHIISTYTKLHNIKDNLITSSVYTTSNRGILKISLYDEGNLVLENQFDIKNKSNNFSFKFENLTLWDINNPKLYNIVYDYYIDDILVDKKEQRMGFRVIEFKTSGFYLNEKVRKLRGFSRQQSYPYVGNAMPKSVQARDADILKYELGANFVKASNYIQSSHFLDRCDEIGLLVLEEIPGLGYLGDDEYKERIITNIQSMIDRDYHHPSVILWGIGVNNFLDNEFYIDATKIAKLYDSSRATSGANNIQNNVLYSDVFIFNDYIDKQNKGSIINRSEVGKKVPYIVNSQIGNFYSIKRIDNEMMMANQALIHYDVLEEANRMKHLSGVITSSLTDYHTNNRFGSEDNIRYTGVLDMFRLPKYAASIYKLFMDIEPFIDILSSLSSGEYETGNLDVVYLATNVEFIRLYRDDEYVGSFYPDSKSKLKYPIIKIDDFIGNVLVSKEKLSKRSSKIIKKNLLEFKTKGINITSNYRFKMALARKKNKVGKERLEQLVNKYGNLNSTFRFDGIARGLVVVSKKISPFKSSKYVVEIDSKKLNHDVTYDATRIVIKRLDQDDNLLRYANDVVSISVNDSLEVIGNSKISLIGGAIAFWVKTTKGNSIGEVNIEINDYIFNEKITIN